jgi:hypothetical protein
VELEGSDEIDVVLGEVGKLTEIGRLDALELELGNGVVLELDKGVVLELDNGVVLEVDKVEELDEVVKLELLVELDKVDELELGPDELVEAEDDEANELVSSSSRRSNNKMS